MSRPKTRVGFTMDLLTKLKKGEYFFAEMTTAQATAYSSSMGIKIQTKKVMLIEDYIGNKPQLKTLLKITVK